MNQETLQPEKIFLLYLFLFIVGCMLGYLLEVLFRRFVSAKKWVNPGFLTGPWLPLYGFGVLVMFTLVMALLLFSPAEWPLYNPYGYYDFRGTVNVGPSWYDLIPISAMGCGMILLEFIAGLIFVKGFKVKLWDYTNMKGNVMGIICPQFNLIWFALAIAYYYGVNPFVFKASSVMYLYMFGSAAEGATQGGKSAHFLFLFFMGLVYGIFLVDFVHSINLFNKVSKFARQSGWVARYEDLQKKYRESTKEAQKKIVDALPERVKKAMEDYEVKKKEGSTVKDKAYSWFSKLIYIDPSKAKETSSNYDAEGRPIGSKEDN